MPILINIFKPLFILFAAGILTACGPIYKTQYSYAPPKSSAGMMCITNCSSTKNSCRQIEELKAENCKTRIELAYQYCKQHEKYCYRESCYSNYTTCENEYNTCYQNCGGSITTNQVCTAFCN